ncbi:hypothetical protein EJP69_14685 [Variovorax gossypii]|uniref:Uncharacterized protein n=1 Tax=Variovorax gossypii TaxID=1679495 RepID=A0A3S0QBK7_9BURK|nr:hypothetical protein [Variovorax gossypii]RTQ35597.1 hypothetical protein EJP69_14685 [Variovorax gossypii]
MEKFHSRLSIAAIAVSASLATFADEVRVYLPPQKAAEVLADGVPWSAAAPNGRSFKLALNKDGTGSISGGLPFALSVTWEVKGETVCLSGTMMAKCLRFQEIPGGFQSWDGDKPDLKLSR